ncbi:unnamed protein product [Trichogramma brassicae]|uniref:Uncharacterized protein n=1 Tax=Trichogramma brassicae TaxID=86971 RepID=A0A6H5ICQ0_9HYME|nr:unnamed protein product [Trichogramma brassicae]
MYRARGASESEFDQRSCAMHWRRKSISCRTFTRGATHLRRADARGVRKPGDREIFKYNAHVRQRRRRRRRIRIHIIIHKHYMWRVLKDFRTSIFERPRKSYNARGEESAAVSSSALQQQQQLSSNRSLRLSNYSSLVLYVCSTRGCGIGVYIKLLEK